MAQLSKVSGIDLNNRDDPRVAALVRNLDKFQRYFCELMADRIDFTLRLEVHGVNGTINHCRVYRDEIDKPGKQPG